MSEVAAVKSRLEDQVKLSISIVGVGNAGNQAIAQANKSGYPVFAINSSLKDLSDEVVNAKIPSFLIGREARGAGKNRDVAKALFNLNGKQLFSPTSDNENSVIFIDMVKSSDIVFVVGSTAGGTGSGVAPLLCQILQSMYPKKIIIYYGIIPKLADSVQAQYNTLDCITEISKLSIPYMLADLSFYEDIANDIAYAGIAKHIVNGIDIISGKFLHYSSSGMIDENDMKVIVGEPGYMATYFLDGITHQQIDTMSVQSHMIKKIKSSPATAIPRDGIVKELGVIQNFPDEMAEASKAGIYTELTEYIGVPFAIFENYSTNNETTGQFITILSGMSLPYARLSQCKEVIAASQEKLLRQKKIDLGSEMSQYEFVRQQSSQSKIAQDLIGGSDTDPLEEAEAADAMLDKFFH